MKKILILVALFLAFGFVGDMDYADALTTDAIRKDPPKDYFPPSLVIPYSAQICQDSDSTKKPKCKWYVSGTIRKEIRK